MAEPVIDLIMFLVGLVFVAPLFARAGYWLAHKRPYVSQDKLLSKPFSKIEIILIAIIVSYIVFIAFTDPGFSQYVRSTF